MSTPQNGAQNERTALAWQRTALSLLAGAAVFSRLTFDRLGPVGLLSVGVALPLTLWVFLESRGRYRDTADMQLRNRPRGGRGAPLTNGVVGLVGAR